MILVDANVLLYAVNDDAPLHAPAAQALEEWLSGSETVGFAWVVLLAFIRISTRPSALPRPSSIEEAFADAEAWLSAAPARVVHPTSRHFDLVRGLIGEAGIAGNLTTDAHLAALAIENAARVATFDRDFGRFSGVQTLRPGT